MVIFLYKYRIQVVYKYRIQVSYTSMDTTRIHLTNLEDKLLIAATVGVSFAGVTLPSGYRVPIPPHVPGGINWVSDGVGLILVQKSNENTS